MEIEVLFDERSNVEEVVSVTLSELVVDLKASLVSLRKEILDLEVLGEELVIRALINEDGS